METDVHGRDPRDAEADLAMRSTASQEALRELALALRTSVETMHGVRDLQAELVKSLKRQDRSELVLQSTQALNDTFRNLASIQRELLSRLEAPAKAGPGRLVPLMMLGLLLVFLGGVYVILDVLDTMKADRSDQALIASQASEHTLQAFREGKTEGTNESELALSRLEDQLRQTEDRERALRERLDQEGGSRADLEAEVKGLAAERDALAGQIRAAQNEVLARRAVEEELRDTSARLAVMEPRMRDLETAIAAEKAENVRLLERLAALGLGRPDPAAEETPKDASEETGPAPEDVPPPRVHSRVIRDAQLLDKIRGRLNTMLDQSGTGREDLWQVTRIDGVHPQGMEGVIALRYDRRSGRLLEQVQASDLEIWVDRNARSVELLFRNGSLSTGLGSQPFQGGELRLTVAGGEMTTVWSQSGMTFLRYR